MSLYIPRGYVTTADAVARLFQARHPDLAASTLARSAEMRRLYGHYCAEFPGPDPIPGTLLDAIRLREADTRRRAIIAAAVDPRHALKFSRRPNSAPKQPVGTFGEEDLARLRELDRIASEQRRLECEAAIELRSALAEGDLVAVLNYKEMPLISRFRWREDDGLTIACKGYLSHQLEGTLTHKVKRAVLIKKAELEGWLRSVLQADPADGNAQPAVYPMTPTAREVGDPIDTAKDSAQLVTRADNTWIPENVSEEYFEVVKNAPGGGNKVTKKVEDEMYRDVTTGKITVDEFRRLSQPAVAKRFTASREVTEPARERILARLKTEALATKQKKQIPTDSGRNKTNRDR